MGRGLMELQTSVADGFVGHVDLTIYMQEQPHGVHQETLLMPVDRLYPIEPRGDTHCGRPLSLASNGARTGPRTVVNRRAHADAQRPTETLSGTIFGPLVAIDVDGMAMREVTGQPIPLPSRTWQILQRIPDVLEVKRARPFWPRRGCCDRIDGTMRHAASVTSVEYARRAW
jgi:hypothetical protein